MADPKTPQGRLLITGPTGSGKTRRTAGLLDAWVDQNGPDDVVILEFAPEHETEDGRILGRRLERFMEMPYGVQYLVVRTRAPRAWAGDEEEAIALAHENMENCRDAIQAASARPAGLFVNDATIAFHEPGSDPAPLLRLVQAARVAVVNALDPQGFEPEHPITKQERRVLAALEQAVHRVARLEEPPDPDQERQAP